MTTTRTLKDTLIAQGNSSQLAAAYVHMRQHLHTPAHIIKRALDIAIMASMLTDESRKALPRWDATALDYLVGVDKGEITPPQLYHSSYAAWLEAQRYTHKPGDKARFILKSVLDHIKPVHEAGGGYCYSDRGEQYVPLTMRLNNGKHLVGYALMGQRHGDWLQDGGVFACELEETNEDAERRAKFLADSAAELEAAYDEEYDRGRRFQEVTVQVTDAMQAMRDANENGTKMLIGIAKSNLEGAVLALEVALARSSHHGELTAAQRQKDSDMDAFMEGFASDTGDYPDPDLFAIWTKVGDDLRSYVYNDQSRDQSTG